MFILACVIVVLRTVLTLNRLRAPFRTYLLIVIAKHFKYETHRERREVRM